MERDGVRVESEQLARGFVVEVSAALSFVRGCRRRCSRIAGDRAVVGLVLCSGHVMCKTEFQNWLDGEIGGETDGGDSL